MWFYYLISAIGVSIGTGAFVASNAEQKANISIQIEEPEVNAKQAAQVSRSLRRLYQLDPTAFPAPGGKAPVGIPQNLIDTATAGGVKIPKGISFQIDATGRITTSVDLNNTDINRESYQKTLDRIGITPDPNIMNRSSITIPPTPITDADKQNDTSKTKPYNPDLKNNSGGISTPGKVIGVGHDGKVIIVGGINNIDPDYADEISPPDPVVIEEVIDTPETIQVIDDPDTPIAPLVELKDNGGVPAVRGVTIYPGVTQDRQDTRYQFEREFDASCVSILKLSEGSIKSLMVNFHQIRLTDKEREINSFYNAQLPQKDGQASDILTQMSGQAEEIERRRDAEILALPSQINEEVAFIGEGIMATGQYCAEVYDMRDSNKNSNIQLNTLRGTTVIVFNYAATDIIDAKLHTDPGINQSTKQDMGRVSNVIRSIVSAYNMVQKYPEDPQKIIE
jgi:hypothetical protein